jgi:steroid delta-isomerase-like uncharacterized protein
MSITRNRDALRGAFLEVIEARLGPKMGSLCVCGQNNAGRQCGHKSGEGKPKTEGESRTAGFKHSAVESTKVGWAGTAFAESLNSACRRYNSSDTGKKEIRLTEDNCSIVRRFIDETINRGEIDTAAQFVWEDVVEQVPFPGQGPGVEGLKDVLRGMRNAFPDLNFAVEEQIAEGDKVLTRFEWTGTHRGDFLGVSATGRSVKVWGMVIDRLQRGRIKETRIIMDIFGLMMQLGAIAPKA